LSGQEYAKHIYIRSKTNPDDLEWRDAGLLIHRPAENFNFAEFDFQLYDTAYTEYSDEWVTEYNKIKLWMKLSQE